MKFKRYTKQGEQLQIKTIDQFFSCILTVTPHKKPRFKTADVANIDETCFIFGARENQLVA